jgi:hypothetical protein
MSKTVVITEDEMSVEFVLVDKAGRYGSTVFDTYMEAKVYLHYKRLVQFFEIVKRTFVVIKEERM